MLVKAIACELPAKRGLPLSRFSCGDIAREVERSGLVATISDKTVWRWLSEDAIGPWQHRCWIFPRAPDFAVKAGRILDLYARRWQGKPLGRNDFVISTDEKTSIQARRRIHATLAPGLQRSMRVEHEYERCGAWEYLAAMDVHRMKLFGRCEKSTGIEPFDKLVADVMSQPPYKTARRVFWIMDNGSSHRGQTCVARLRQRWPTIIAVHTPIHASWLNQVEVYFSVVQRKVLTPNDFRSLTELEDRLLRFQDHYAGAARPFQWKFTRENLDALLVKLQTQEILLAKAA